MKRAGQYICAANCSGAVHIIDPNTLRVLKVWQAHMGTINDMDAKADYLVTCGLSQRQQLGLLPDPLANVVCFGCHGYSMAVFFGLHGCL